MHVGSAGARRSRARGPRVTCSAHRGTARRVPRSPAVANEEVTTSCRAPQPPAATEAPPAATVAVRLRGIGKRFPGVIANDDINIDVRRGTIHAIVGENGAGKSTLMKILYGVQPPDSGTIEINGDAGRPCTRRRTPSRPASAWCSSTSCSPTTSPSSRTSCSAPRSCTASARGARAEINAHLRRLRARASSPTGWSRSSASAPASGSRSSRCSTAAPGSSSSTSRPRCWCRRRSTSCSTTCAS